MLQSRRADPRIVDATGDERPEIAARTDGDGILKLADEQDAAEVRMVDGFQSEEQVHGRRERSRQVLAVSFEALLGRIIGLLIYYVVRPNNTLQL